MCNEKRSRAALSSHFLNIVHHTSRRTNENIMILISRCSGPLLRTVRGRPLLGSCHSALGTFCNILGDTSHCLHFTFLANIAGFSRMDIFDSLGRLGSVDLGCSFSALYKVAHRRLLTGFRPRVTTLSRTGSVGAGRIIRAVAQRCSNCRFRPGKRKIFGPFDILGTFFDGRFNGC